MTEPRTFGGRLRAARYARNLTLQQLSDLTATADQPGISVGQLSHLEHGTRRLDKQSTVARLANALGIDPARLTGMPLEHVDPELHEAQAVIAPLRLALVSSYLGRRNGEARPVAAITPEVDAVVALRTQARLAEMGRALPKLIRELYSATAHAGGEEREETLRQLVRVLNSAMTVAHALDYPDLAYMVTMRSVETAVEMADSAWVAIAQHGACHAMLPMGGAEEAHALASDAVDAAAAGADDVGLAAYGSLLLVSAKMAAQAGHGAEAAQRLDEAARVAELTGENGPDVAFFGPSNVGLYRMAAALEQDDLESAAQAARVVDISRVSSAERRAKFGLDRARALAGLRGQAEAAVASLVGAEQEAPLLVRGNPVARDLLPGLVGACRPGTAAGRDARGLAWRMGLGSVVA